MGSGPQEKKRVSQSGASKGLPRCTHALRATHETPPTVLSAASEAISAASEALLSASEALSATYETLQGASEAVLSLLNVHTVLNVPTDASLASGDKETPKEFIRQPISQSKCPPTGYLLFRWVHPSLYEGVTVGRSVGPSVRRSVTTFFEFTKMMEIDVK